MPAFSILRTLQTIPSRTIHIPRAPGESPKKKLAIPGHCRLPPLNIRRYSVDTSLRTVHRFSPLHLHVISLVVVPPWWEGIRVPLLLTCLSSYTCSRTRQK